MSSTAANTKNVLTGICLAISAVLIWSGNFVIARGIYKEIAPVSLAFFRWVTASVIIIPFSIKYIRSERNYVLRSWKLILAAAVTGVSLFNTLIYIGAHSTSAINLALIGNTVSPIASVLLAFVFLNEKIGWLKIAGMILCCCGIVYLLARGDSANLLSLKFSSGDGWMVLAAFSFAVYNILARKKPGEISPVFFLAVTFVAGTLLLLPFFLLETKQQEVSLNIHLSLIVIYLGLGASVISFFCWNYAIRCIGAGRTALFGNLIPLFSSIEAIIFLHEPFTGIHLVSMILIASGLVLANLSPSVNQ
jgi:drug/metabolite transporter (DMT)-like permease